MRFGDVSVDDARGCILAHRVRMTAGVLKDGLTSNDAEIEQLRENRSLTVMAACPKSGDVLENDAAARIARVISGANIAAAEPLTGRTDHPLQRTAAREYPNGIPHSPRSRRSGQTT